VGLDEFYEVKLQPNLAYIIDAEIALLDHAARVKFRGVLHCLVEFNTRVAAKNGDPNRDA
jgi:hypothetical protein